MTARDAPAELAFTAADARRGPPPTDDAFMKPPSNMRPLHAPETLRPLFAPRSVAIVGVSTRAGSFGERAWANMASYKGRLYAVNPRYDNYAGGPCYPDLAALPEVPDCVLLATAREQCEDVITQCARLGVRAAVMFASGYAETGKPERIEDQRRLAALASDNGVRILGPNCMGIVNNAQGIDLTFAPRLSFGEFTGPGIGLVSQSGAIAFALAEGAARGKAFSHILTTGNAIDVDVADQIAYLAQDDHCRAIACVFEGIAEPARLIQAGRLARRAGKPVVAFKVARSDEGAAAAVSHTATLAGSDAGYTAAFERAGIVVVDQLEHLLDTATFFAKAVCLPPAAAGVAVISASGGMAIAAADKAAISGVPLPQPSASVQSVLQSVIPEFGSPRNPCDLTAQVMTDPASLFTCVEAMLSDASYGAMVHPHLMANDRATERLRNLDAVAGQQRKLVCVIWASEWLEGPGASVAERLPHIAVFRSMSACFSALRARTDWQAISDALPEHEPCTVAGARENALRVLAKASAEVLTEGEGMRVLEAYEIPVVANRLTRSEDEAVAAAASAGYPVVMKIVSPDVPHKTEVGGVKLDLRNEEAVRAAYRSIMDSTRAAVPHARIDGVVVQPMVPSGVELVLGARRDPLFGPLLMVGLGGIFVELLQDVAVRIAPVSHEEARQMLQRLRGSRLLKGFRGAPAVDLEQLAQVISRFSVLAAELGDQLEEIDVNPLICSGGRILAVDALMRRRQQDITNP